MDERATTDDQGLEAGIDLLSDDEGGVPFDDDFDDDAPEEPGDRGTVPGAPAYDSGKILQGRGIGYPDRTPVGMNRLRDALVARWGGVSLGCLSKPPRPMRGGSAPSLHCWGIALDWRWQGPGPGRPGANEVIDFLLEHASALGIQGVHDYEACKYWKSYSGWNTAKKSASSGFGQPWAQWLHIERTWAAANDDRTLDQALDEAGATVKLNTGGGGGGGGETAGTATTVLLPEPVVKEGQQGANVARLQDFLRFFKFADFKRSDGQFGPRTLAAVKKAQQAFAAKGWYTSKVDGEFGPKSAAAAAKFLAAATG